MTARLPPAASVAAFRELTRRDPRIIAGADRLCRELGLGRARLFETGSLPVFEAGESHVLKLYPPCFAHEGVHEELVLSRLEGRLPLATPRIIVDGELDGWRYLVMDRIPGAPLDAVWGALPPSDRIRFARELGRFLGALHAIDAGDVRDGLGGWPRFLREQAERCVDAQRRRSLAPEWLEQIPSFLARSGLVPVERPVLLHTEIMRAHVLAVRDGTGWSLSGVVDFEPAMLGAPEYEFASVGVFLTCGSGPALRALLLAYGYGEGELGPALQRRLLAYTLLHRYSNLRWYLERLPPPAPISRLDALAARWFALGDEPELAADRRPS